MKLTVRNTKDKKITIHDAWGQQIKACTYFDTKTHKITFLLPYVNEYGQGRCFTELDSKGKRRAKKITTIWKGAYAIVDGVKIEEKR